MESILHRLLILIAILLSINIEVDASISCADASPTCECFKRGQELELQCPSRENLEAVVRYRERFRIEVNCRNPGFKLNSLGTKIASVSWLKMQYCKPSTQSELFFTRLRNDSQLIRLEINKGNLENADLNVLEEFIRSLRLQTIILLENRIENFPRFFSNLPHLEHLDLSGNLIKELPDRLQMPSIVALFLLNNSISNLNEFIFQNSSKLRYLDLSMNNITRLPPRLLHSLPDLRFLSLSSNNFREIPSQFLEKNTVLRDLRLNNGHVTDISNIFWNFTHLKTLTFRNNSMKTLSDEIFVHLSNLTQLELGDNLFSDFGENTFKGLENLQELFLFSNSLTRWSESYNVHLRSLTNLELNNNSLSKIEAKTFYGLFKLKKLELRHNSISQIDVSAFENLRTLTRLDLSFNKLKTFDSVLLGRINSITIDLSFNYITSISMPTRSSSTVLQSGNKHTSKSYLGVLGNPLNCDCKATEFLKRVRTISNGECAFPAKWTGTKLKDIDFDLFTCEDTIYYDCPNSCSCKIYPMSHVFAMNCSNARLRRPPVIPHLNEVELQSLGITVQEVWMNLENNLIEEFTAKDYSNYINVTVLNLSNNKLNKINVIPPRVKVLNLDKNSLSNMNYKTILLLNNSETLEHLTLHDNPWYCDCQMMNLSNILQEQWKELVSNDTILCSDGLPLLELDEKRACNINTNLLIFLLILISVAVLFAITLLILYLRYEHYIKIWMYNHKLLLSLIKEDDLDQNKVYDAFISYSHKDEDFVAKCLVPELENGPEKYKLCLHVRDWIVGEYIPKQIADSVHNSRRTIIVLSRNFLNSDWATMEFKTAHQKSMNEERIRLIIILYEDVDLGDITDEELKIYLNTNTYIKWGDPWFWKKLRKALPGRKHHGTNSKRKRIADVEKQTDT